MLCLEPLEDRTLLSTLFVVNAGDSGPGCANAGDLHYCITQVNATSGPNIIAFALPGTGVQTIHATPLGNATAGVFVLDANNTIGGPAPGATANGTLPTNETTDPATALHQVTASGPLAADTVSATVARLAPTVQTDKLDYSPGQTATITGSGFQAGETVDMQVVNTATGTPAGNPPTWTVVADTNGNIQTSWTCTSDLLGDTLQLSATGESSGLTASETFKDSNPTTTTVTASPNPSNSGQSVTFTATVTNTQSNSSPPGSVDFYDGVIDSSHLLGSGTLSGNGNSATATFATATLSVGSHTIYAVYMPSANGFDSSTDTVSQNVNAAVAPTVSADKASVTAPENQAATNTGTWSDSDDSVTLSADQGTLTQNANGTWSWSGTGDEDSPYNVTITATNADGSKATTSFNVSFTDVAPTISANSASVSAPENQTATNTGSFSDYDDGVTITVSTGTVTQDNSKGTWSWSGTGDVSSPYTVTITATNADGSKATTSFGVSFTDVAPNVAADHASVSAAENAAATNTGTWSGSNVTLSASSGTVTENSNGTWSWSGTGDESNNGTVTITATDNNNQTATTSFSLTFTEVAPTVAADHASVSAAENAAASNTGTFADFDDAVTITASTGTVTQTSGKSGTWSWSGTGDESSPYSVTITATDADGDTTTTSFNVSFTDVAPSVSADKSAVTVPENQAASNTGTWSDDDDSVTLSADRGTLTQNANGTWSWSGTGDENSPYTVTITATNADGSKATTSFGVSFTDVPPTVAADHASVSAAENQVATNTGTWSDYDDPVSLSASYGTVMQNNDGTWSWSGTGDKSNNGTVTITATNADGSKATTSFSLTFTEVAPNVAVTTAPTNVVENTPASASGIFSDHDGNVTLSASEGNISQTSSTNGTWNWSETAPLSDGVHTVTITAKDSDGSTSSTNFTFTVTDVAPSVAVATAPLSSVAENTNVSASGTFSDYDDPVTITASEGSISQTGSTNGTWSWLETAPLSDGTHTVTITATNSDGSTSSTNFTFTVTDVAPSVTIAGNNGLVVVNAGQPMSLTGSFTAPDGDQGTGTVDYGDGLGMQPLPLEPNHTFTLNHTYQQEGSFLVTVAITDDGGASGSASIPIEVYNAGVDLTQLKRATAASPTISDPGITATLSTASPTASLLLAPVIPNEVEQLGGGAFPAGSGTFVSAYDFRSVNLTAQDEVVGIFQFPPGRTPTLEYFDSSSQSFKPVLGSTLQPNSLVIDPVHGTITLILDGSSTPRLTDLTGTVFVVSIPQTPPSPPVVSPLPSPAPASAPPVDAEATTETATFSTLLDPVFAQLSTPVVSFPSATESSAAAQEATTGTATLSTLSVPVLQSGTSIPITPANTQTASNNPSVNAISAFSPLVLMFTALHPGTSGGEVNAGAEANLSLTSPPDVLSLLNRLPRAPALQDSFTPPDSGPRGVLSPSRAGFPEGADGAEAPGQAPTPIPTPPRNNPPPVGLRVRPTGHQTTNEHETRLDEDHFGGATWLDEVLSELIRRLTWHQNGSEGEKVPVHPAIAVLILGAGFVSRAAQRTMPLSRSRARSGID